MKPFMDKNFLLDTEAARELYFGQAAPLPIFDYHCHLSPREIAENKPFSDIAEIWLKGDHYKWRIMRSNGADESLCSGQASWEDKFVAYAQALEKSAGNPLLHWSHLELQRAYGIDDILTQGNALKIRQWANEIIRERKDSPRSMLTRFNVAVVCTTDDPADDLGWHRQIAADPEFGTEAARAGKKTTRVLPTFRPDRIMNVQDAAAWKNYAVTLGNSADIEIKDFASLREALARRHAYFHANGCRLSDHALLTPPFALASEAELDSIIESLLEGRTVSAEAAEKMATAVLIHCAQLNAQAGWIMQLHIGALRNTNTRLFRLYGPDGGGDSISDSAIVLSLARLLDHLDTQNSLPKTILYSLDATRNASLAVLAQSFAMHGSPGKIQYGSAWWFNDHKDGMQKHLVESASVSLIGRWVGMLTDSRSFLSFPRHEYFRRILCRVVGRWIEDGELPAGEAYADALVRNISWYNARDYFGMEVPKWAQG